MADNNSKAYQEALRQLDNMVKKQEALKKSTESLNNSWQAISSEIFKLDGAEFFKKVEKSPEQIQALGKEIEDLTSEYKMLGNTFADMLDKSEGKFKDIQTQIQSTGDKYANFSKTVSLNMQMTMDLQRDFSDELKKKLQSEKDIEKILSEQGKWTDKEIESLKKIKEFQEFEKDADEQKKMFQKEMQAHLEELIKQNSEIATLSKEAQENMMSQIAAGKSVAEMLENATEEERKFLALLSENPEELKKISKGMSQIVGQVEDLKKEAGEMNKQFSLFKGFASGIGNMIKRDWVGAITQFDTVLNDVQKKTSINMDDNADAFARLQTEVAQYGMSVEQAGQMMTDMSKELNTTNFSLLSNAAKDFAAIEGATGAASGDITNIAGEMMRMGQSSKQVKDYMEGADQEARKFGVSSSKVIGGISRNIKKIREMGFVGGEKSLMKMAVTAERLKMNMDETFDMAKRARNIEGAMEMAAELQLAGGSFSNINPMDLLAAARKGPAELQKILTTMGKDIGHFSEETGKFEFDPVDVDRLQMVSDATELSMESLQNMIEQNAMDTAKLDPFKGMMDGLEEADQEIAKSALSDMITRNKDGTLTINAESDMAKKMGVDSLEDINSDTIAAMVKQKQEDAATLEEQNKRNQSLKDAFNNLVNAFMSMFSVFQPVIEVLTSAIQFVTEIVTGIQKVLGEMGMFGTVIKWAIPLLLLFGTSFGSSVLTFVTKGLGGFTKMLSGKGGMIGKLLGRSGGAGAGDDIASKAMGDGGKVAQQPGMTPQAGQGIKGFFTGLADGIKAFGGVKWQDLLKFGAALAIVGGAIIGFGIAMASIGGDAGIGQMVTAAISLGLLMGAIFILSKIAGQVDMGGVLKGALAMLVVGASLIPFAFAAQMLTDVDWLSVLAGIGVIALVVLGLMLLGAMMMGPQILFLLIGVGVLIMVGAALMMAAGGLLMAAEAFQELGAIDWTAFTGMGSALLSVVPGLLAFSLASMMFMNPLALLGIIMMTWAIGGLVAVMAPLAESLTIGADSLDRFAEGLTKLGEAADKLSTEKLEALRALSDIMANSSAGGAAMAAMAAVANSAGGGGGGGDVRKIEVDVKLNGRELQNFIVKDTAIVK